MAGIFLHQALPLPPEALDSYYRTALVPVETLRADQRAAQETADTLRALQQRAAELERQLNEKAGVKA